MVTVTARGPRPKNLIPMKVKIWSTKKMVEAWHWYDSPSLPCHGILIRLPRGVHSVLPNTPTISTCITPLWVLYDITVIRPTLNQRMLVQVHDGRVANASNEKNLSHHPGAEEWFLSLFFPRHPWPPPEVRYLDPQNIPKTPNLRRYIWMYRVSNGWI